jgi:hypothetical protein
MIRCPSCGGICGYTKRKGCQYRAPDEFRLKMTVDDALKFADDWSRGMTLHADSQGWRVVCMLLAEEVRRLRKEIT